MTQPTSLVDHLIIPASRVPAAAYQALYHKLTSKVEKLTETFADAYYIGTEDIIQLDHRLSQVIKQYPVKSQNAVCSLILRKGERIDSSSVDKFRTINFATPKTTQAVNYEFYFFTILPVEIKDAEDIVQRFKVSVLVDQDFMEEEDDGVPLFLKGMVSGNNIRLMVEYSDYAVGRNLQMTVQDWVSNLESKKIPALFSFMDNRSDAINAFVPLSFSASLLFGYSRIYYIDAPGKVASTVIFAVAIAIAMYLLGRFLNVQLYRQLQISKPLTYLNFTTGDRTRSNSLKSKQTRRLWLAGFFGVTIIVGILVNLFSSILADWLDIPS